MIDVSKEYTFFDILGEQDLNAYLFRISDPTLFDESLLPSGIRFASLTSAKCTALFGGKIGWVKRWFKEQSDARFLDGTKLHISPSFQSNCFMDDAGNVWFPWRIFFKRFDAVVKYAFHESAHLWLAKQEYYPALLALDRSFTERFKEEGAILVSPIECCATRLSAILLDQAIESLPYGTLSSRLRIQKEMEESKLSDCIRDFLAKLPPDAFGDDDRRAINNPNRRKPMKNEITNKTDAIEKKQDSYKELLEQYTKQSNEEVTHSYSEVLHHDYSDSCCC